MSPWKWIRSVGVAAQSIKGWMAIVSVAPSIAATLFGLIDSPLLANQAGRINVREGRGSANRATSGHPVKLAIATRGSP